MEINITLYNCVHCELHCVKKHIPAQSSLCWDSHAGVTLGSGAELSTESQHVGVACEPQYRGRGI